MDTFVHTDAETFYTSEWEYIVFLHVTSWKKTLTPTYEITFIVFAHAPHPSPHALRTTPRAHDLRRETNTQDKNDDACNYSLALYICTYIHA